MDSQQPSPSLNKLIKHYEKKIAEMNKIDLFIDKFYILL